MTRTESRCRAEREGQTTAFALDARKLLVKTTFRRDGRTDRVHAELAADAGADTGPRRAETLYGYDPKMQLTSVTDPMGNVWTFTYDEVGNRTSQTDPNGTPPVSNSTKWATRSGAFSPAALRSSASTTLRESSSSEGISARGHHLRLRRDEPAGRAPTSRRLGSMSTRQPARSPRLPTFGARRATPTTSATAWPRSPAENLGLTHAYDPARD
jgi:YD repeat-containing protein